VSEIPCDVCKTPTQATALRPWLHTRDNELRHLPGRGATVELKLCPECFAAAREDERQAFSPARTGGLVLAALFVVVLLATFGAPTVWTTVARWIYGTSQKEQIYNRSVESAPSGTWRGKSFSTPGADPDAASPPTAPATSNP